MKKILLPLMVLALISGCTKNSGSGSASDAGSATPEKTISLGSVAETMAYDKTDLTVPAGQDITLTFKNNSTTLQHNWVLTQPGKENEVGLAGIKAGAEKGFIPDDPAVLAHTKLVDAGGSDTITFKAPPAGDYPFICTNAGHHTVMKGTLHSK
jgi:azurin